MILHLEVWNKPPEISYLRTITSRVLWRPKQVFQAKSWCLPNPNQVGMVPQCSHNVKFQHKKKERKKNEVWTNLCFCRNVICHALLWWLGWFCLWYWTKWWLQLSNTCGGLISTIFASEVLLSVSKGNSNWYLNTSECTVTFHHWWKPINLHLIITDSHGRL